MRLRGAAALAFPLLAFLLLVPGADANRTRGPYAFPITVSVLETSADLSERLSPMPSLTFSSRAPNRNWIVHVDDSKSYQRIVGVGGAMTDSSAWLIGTKLGPYGRGVLMSNLFGASGDHLSFLRLPMGASDFSANGIPYSYDDLPRGQTDPTLRHFSVAHDDAYIIPTVRQALGLNHDLDILANPWSPPGWMKTNDALDNTHSSGTLLQDAYEPLAQYFVKFVRAYAEHGIPIDGVTPQNEPGSPAQFPGMNFPEADEAKFIATYLQPAFAAAGLRTTIYGADTGWSDVKYADRLITGPAHAAFGGIAEHCYNGIPDMLSGLHELDPALSLVVSECAEELTPWPVPEVVIGSFRNWANAVALWNLALNPSGGPVQPPDSGCGPCRGLTVVDPATHKVAYSLAFYQLGQFGRWLEPGAVRIASDHFVTYVNRSRDDYGATSGLDDAAFLNPDGSRVVVAYDNSRHYVRFSVAWDGLSFHYALTPGATVTFRWRP